MGNLRKPNLSGGVKTGFRPLTKASPKRANVVGELAGGNKMLTLRGGKGHNSAAPTKSSRKKMY